MPIRRILLTEEQLVEALKTKSRQGAEALYDMYSKNLFGVLLQIVKNEETAEDLLQQSFIKIWTSFDNYDAEKGRLFTWMMTIAKNLAKDALRTRSYHQKLVTEPLELHYDYIKQRDSEIINTDAIGIKVWVDMLKKDQRDVLTLIYFKGYTHQEAADELGVPLGTVKTRCRAAICMLRGILTEPVKEALIA